MAEIVESLELEIRTNAAKAKEGIDNLATSVSSFGKTVSEYSQTLSEFSKALLNISQAASGLKGIGNIKSLVSAINGASTAGKKASGITKVVTDAVKAQKAVKTVGTRSKNVTTADGRGYQFSESSASIGKRINSTYKTIYSNAEISERINGIRNKMLSGGSGEGKDWVSDLEDLAEDIASSAGVKSSSTALAEAVDKYFLKSGLAVSEGTAGAFGGIREVNRILKGAGSKTRAYIGEETFDKLFSGGLGSVAEVGEEQFGLMQALAMTGTTKVEDLLYHMGSGTNNMRSRFLEKLGTTDSQVRDDILQDLLGSVSHGYYTSKAPEATQTTVSSIVEEAKEAVEEQLTELKESVVDTTSRDYIRQENAAWAGHQRLQREAMRNWEKDNKLNWNEVEGWKRINEGVSDVDNTEQEIAEWKASAEEQEAYLEDMKLTAEEIVASKEQIGDLSVKEVVEDVTGISREMSNAAESAKDFMDAFAESDRRGIYSFAEYTGKDWSKENEEDTEYFNKRLEEIWSQPNAAENTLAAIRRKKATGSFFEEPPAQDISEAEEETHGLTAAARETAEEFMQTADKAEILRMKLADVSTKLEEAINADDYDEGKIARLADQYNKLCNQIDKAESEMKDLSDATEEETGHAMSLRSALSDSIKNSIFGKLKSTLERIGLRNYAKSILSGVSTGISNLYQWSKQFGNSDFSSAMDTYASKIMLVKNSLATALAPAIETAINWFSSIVPYINAASNALSQFMALLTGSDTWTAATESAEEWAAATTSGASDASDSIKDLLADWDELNIIQSESSSSSGSGGTNKNSDYDSMFEEMSTFDDWTEHFETIRDIVTDIAAGIIGWFAISGIESFLSKLGIAGDNVASIFSKIRAGVTGAVLLLVSFKLAEAVGEAVAVEGATFENIAESIGTMIAGGLGGSFVANAVGASSVLGFITGVSAVVVIGLTAYFKKNREVTYATMARNSFANVGKEGFDTEKYKEEVEKELNKRIGNLSVSIEAFESYGTAKKNLEDATTALSELGKYVYGEKKLTAEQAEEFKKNWQTVYEAVNQMHTATWNTINLGIADAMRDETEQGRKYLSELQQQMIELARLTGGAEAAWKEETSQIASRITSGTASDADIERYTVLLELMGGEGTSESLTEMQNWSGTVHGFNFGDGDEAVENAVAFVEEMKETYESATSEVEEWGKTQGEAVSAAKKELEGYYKAGYIDKSDYDNGVALLDQWETTYKEKVKKNLEEIEKLKNGTYDEIFGQIVSGYVNNQTNGGNGAEYVDQVSSLVKALQDAGYEIDDLYTWFSDRGDFWETIDDFFDGLGGQDRYSNMPVEEKYAEGTNYAFIADAPPGWILIDGEYKPILAEPDPVKLPFEELTEYPDGVIYDSKTNSFTYQTEDGKTVTVGIGTGVKPGGFDYDASTGAWTYEVKDPETVTLKTKAGATPQGFTKYTTGYKPKLSGADPIELAVLGGKLPDGATLNDEGTAITYKTQDADGVEIQITSQLPEGMAYDDATGQIKLQVADAEATIHFETDMGDMTINEDGSWVYTPKKTQTVYFDNPNWKYNEETGQYEKKSAASGTVYFDNPKWEYDEETGQYVRKNSVSEATDEVKEEMLKIYEDTIDAASYLLLGETGMNNYISSLLSEASTGTQEWAKSNFLNSDGTFDLMKIRDYVFGTDWNSGGGGGADSNGDTSFFNPDQPIVVDGTASGVALDASISAMETAITGALSTLGSLIGRANTLLGNVNDNTRILANKKWTVNINASTNMGSMIGRSNRMVEDVIG